MSLYRPTLFAAVVFASACAAPQRAPESATAVTATAEPEAIAEGERSSVRLLRAWRLDAKTAATRGAPDGLGFEFLVLRKPGTEGLFTLSELRDAEVAGESYRARTTAALGRAVEPATAIDNVEDVRAADGRTLAELFQTTEAQSAVMRTLLFGAPLPERGEVKVVADLGWGTQTELFRFALRLEELTQQPQAY